jgi:hypothetical protein
MFNPKTEFENERKKFNSKLNFTYEWKVRTDNKTYLLDQVNKYKKELGNYIKLYDDIINISDTSIVDPYTKIYPIYKNITKKLSYLTSTVEKRIKISLDKKFILADDGINYIFSKGNYLYKGVKYFYTPEDEKKFTKSDSNMGFYGDKYLAYYYAKRYNGTLQVYRLKKDLKLFNITNDKNIYLILDQIKINYIDKNKADDIFFDNISYKEFYKSVKTKYGVGINKYFQAYNISKYSKFNDMWLYEPEGELNLYKNNNDKSYTGWYYGAGFIDRICAKGIMLLINDKFNGITGSTGFYSPYVSTTSTEIIIWDQNNYVQRRPKHKYDSMQFMKKLDFDPLKINFNTDFCSLNENFKLVKFYLNNKFDAYSKTKSESISNNTKLLSFCINNFNSINLDDTPKIIIDKLKKLIEINDIDICCLQDCYTNKEILIDVFNASPIMYKIDTTYLSNLGIVLIYKNQITITNKSIVSNLGNKSSAVLFDFNNKKYCVVRLDSGKPLKDRSNSLYEPSTLLNIISFNSNNKINDINKIISNNPDYILGNFSFTKEDKAFEHLTNNKYMTQYVSYTTIDNVQMDFVFSKVKYNSLNTLKFPYSNHLPIVCVE